LKPTVTKAKYTMQSQKLESIKSKHPRLRELIDRLAGYIEAEFAEGVSRVVPALAARHLGLSEAETLGLLAMFEDAGIVRAAYEIICRRTNVVLATAHKRSEIADLLPIHCQFCDGEHDADDIAVELVFEIMPQMAQRNAVA
jgi:hypothetical protein